MAATPRSTPSRRDVARFGAAAAGLGFGALTLGACGSDEEPAAVNPGGGDDAQAGGQVVTPLADVPVGSAVVAQSGDQTVVVAQPEEGQVTAFSARCPHEGCIVALRDAATLECPCHHSTFDALTGAVTKGPATENLAAFGVTVQGANVVTS